LTTCGFDKLCPFLLSHVLLEKINGQILTALYFFWGLF